MKAFEYCILHLPCAPYAAPPADPNWLAGSEIPAGDPLERGASPDARKVEPIALLNAYGELGWEAFHMEGPWTVYLKREIPHASEAASQFKEGSD